MAKKASKIVALYAKLRRDGADLLTPEMIDAGVLELLSHGETREEPAADIVRSVFQAIAEAAPRPPLQRL